jgi:hypothetical protein
MPPILLAFTTAPEDLVKSGQRESEADLTQGRSEVERPYQRVSPIAVRPGEGPLIEPTASNQSEKRELVLLPHCRR